VATSAASATYSATPWILANQSQLIASLSRWLRISLGLSIRCRRRRRNVDDGSRVL